MIRLLTVCGLAWASFGSIGMAVEPTGDSVDDVVARLVRALGTSQAPKALEALTAKLAVQPKAAPKLLRRLTEHASPWSASAVGDLLLRLARKEALSDELADMAAELLDHKDPFVRTLAEWSIATRVGLENNHQEVRWPRPEPPDWYERWSRLSPEFLLESDYARQGIVWDMHLQSDGPMSSMRKVVVRARGAAAELSDRIDAETLAMAQRKVAKVRACHDELVAQLKKRPRDLVRERELWLAARRAVRPIVMANPAVDFDQLVYIKRHSAHSHRNITGSQYPWVHKPGGGIFVQSGLRPNAPTQSVLGDQLGPGHVHGMDLWWDADRLVFAYARQPDWPPRWDTLGGDNVFRLRGDQEPTHLFEVQLDGSGRRQITDNPYWSDLEPTYCANGDIVFASDRSGRSSECGKFSADHTVINLYSVDPDNGNVRRLNDNKDIDRYPHVLDDGTIGYTRWEYQERHFFETHSIWRMHPDGTLADAVFNQHLRAPYGLRDTRSVPNSGKLVAVATGHHTFAYGPIVLVDPRQGINTSEAISIVTPYVQPQEGPMSGRRVAEGGVPDRGGLYQTPYGLSERCFLASYSYSNVPNGTPLGKNAHGFALYLLDVHGNKELIHRDLLLSCAFPMPVRKRTRPPVLADVTEPSQRTASVYVADVHRGMEDVKRGEVKYIRVSQRVGWPLDDQIGAMRWIPGNAWEKKFGYWAWAPVRVLGTVPVEADGSAYFQVPVDTAVYFQALDENHMEVRRMRSHVTFRPGETRGCLGCHETQGKAPESTWNVPMALNREPLVPEPPPWGATTLLGYERLIQPVFDRHCVRCHGDGDPDGGLDLTAARAPDGMMRSFHALFGNLDPKKKSPVLVSVADRLGGAEVSRPKQFGSHKSPLILALLRDELHRDEVKLDPDEWRALVTWVDSNAPYHDTFYNRRPADGGAPRRNLYLEFPDSLAVRVANEALGCVSGSADVERELRIQVKREIEAPVERVFAVFTDIARSPHHVNSIASVELLTDGPPDIGTRWRETRIAKGRETVMSFRISAWERNRGYTIETEAGGGLWTTDYEFTATGLGTIVEMSMSMRPLTLLARVMFPLATPLMKNAIRRGMVEYAEEFAAVAETLT